MDELFKIIESHFEREWDNRTPVVYDNGPVPRDINSEWVRLTVDVLDGEPRSIAYGPKTRYVGNLVLQIYTPLGEGSRTAYKHADRFREIFANQRIENDVVFRSLDIVRVGSPEKVYQLNGIIPFYWDTNQ